MDAAENGCRVVFLGPPGSGKGTQASLLAEELEVPAISTGDMLREAVARGTELGKRVEQTVASGALVNDDLMAEVVRERLAQPDASSGFLLDGYPRTRAQAETLGDILSRSSESLDHVLFIDAPESELVERALSRRRDDDREEVVQERLRVYREQTEPLVDYYRQRSLLREIDGDAPIEDVARAIRRAIGVTQ